VESEAAGIAVNKPKRPKLGSGFAAASLDEKSRLHSLWPSQGFECYGLFSTLILLVPSHANVIDCV
jgi:hypothetical protein